MNKMINYISEVRQTRFGDRHSTTKSLLCPWRIVFVMFISPTDDTQCRFCKKNFTFKLFVQFFTCLKIVLLKIEKMSLMKIYFKKKCWKVAAISAKNKRRLRETKACVRLLLYSPIRRWTLLSSFPSANRKFDLSH